MHRLALQPASLKACRAPSSASRGASMDPGAELRSVAACAAFVGAVRGDIEAAITAVRLAQVRVQRVEAAFAPAVVGSLQHDLGLVLRDMDQVLVYVVELEDRVTLLLDACLRNRAHFFEAP